MLPGHRLTVLSKRLRKGTRECERWGESRFALLETRVLEGLVFGWVGSIVSLREGKGIYSRNEDDDCARRARSATQCWSLVFPCTVNGHELCTNR